MKAITYQPNENLTNGFYVLSGQNKEGISKQKIEVMNQKKLQTQYSKRAALVKLFFSCKNKEVHALKPETPKTEVISKHSSISSGN